MKIATANVYDRIVPTKCEMAGSDQWEAKWHGLQDILGPKWTFHILRLLSDGPHGFNEIKNEFSGLTAPMLSQRLKELRCHGLVERTVIDATPPTTSYELTEQGSQITTQLRGVEELFELHTQEKRINCKSCSDVSQECRSEALESGCVTAVNCC